MSEQLALEESVQLEEKSIFHFRIKGSSVLIKVLHGPVPIFLSLFFQVSDLYS